MHERANTQTPTRACTDRRAASRLLRTTGATGEAGKARPRTAPAEHRLCAGQACRQECQLWRASHAQRGPLAATARGLRTRHTCETHPPYLPKSDAQLTPSNQLATAASANAATARLAQPVERKALNLVVVGSSPTVGAATRSVCRQQWLLHTGVGQCLWRRKRGPCLYTLV